MTKSKIEVVKKTMYIPLSVYRSGKRGLAISCPDGKHRFRYGTSPDQLLFSALVEQQDSN